MISKFVKIVCIVKVLSEKLFIFIIGLCFIFGLCIVAGCISPEKAIRKADAVGIAIVSQYTESKMGNTNGFSIARPSDRLRNRLLLEQNLDPDVAVRLRESLGEMTNNAPLPDPLIISLVDAMKIGAANDNAYQNEKEKVFLQALSLDESRHEFETTFAGVLGLGVAGNTGENGDSRSLSGNVKPSLSEKFRNGITFASSLGLDIVRLLTGDRSTSLGLTGDASLAVPLLRGFGVAVASESLTQAERDMIYSIYEFERYRQSYVVDIADKYYSLLEQQQSHQATLDNLKRLDENFRRSRMLFDAGRLSQVELDQTRQDLLSNRDSANLSEQNLKSSLDAFKISLGLPVDARVALDSSELERVRDTMMNRVTETNSLGQPVQPSMPWSVEAAVDLALTNRIENIVAMYRLEDARRHFALAKDEVLPDLALNISAQYGEKKVTGGDWNDSVSYGANIKFDPVLDGTGKRNAYRRAAITLEMVERDYVTLADKTKKLVRDDFRSLDSAWASYLIQREALDVARSRVESTTIFQQAGKAGTRDVLEAQNALVKARNGLVSALVKYRMAGLQLKRDLSLLKVADDGILAE